MQSRPTDSAGYEDYVVTITTTDDPLLTSLLWEPAPGPPVVVRVGGPGPARSRPTLRVIVYDIRLFLW